MTTERTPHQNGAHARPRKKRASKARLRTTAWIAAGVWVAAPLGALVASPKPAVADPGSSRQVVIVHRTIRRVVIDPPVAAQQVSSGGAPQVHIVYVGGGTVTAGGGGGGGGSAGTTRCSGC